MVERVEIFEVGPRDGPRNAARAIAAADRIALVDCLSATGFSRIEVASSSARKRASSMAGAAGVLRGIRRAPGVRNAALTPNMRGRGDAIAAGADEVAVFASASRGVSRASINASLEESLARFAPVLAAAGSGRRAGATR